VWLQRAAAHNDLTVDYLRRLGSAWVSRRPEEKQETAGDPPSLPSLRHLSVEVKKHFDICIQVQPLTSETDWNFHIINKILYYKRARLVGPLAPPRPSGKKRQ
jgi:hypothetical protein